jgi:hypothetical protein
MLFGTDHPFFSPPGEVEKWRSVMENLEAIEGEDKAGVRDGVVPFVDQLEFGSWAGQWRNPPLDS